MYVHAYITEQNPAPGRPRAVASLLRASIAWVCPVIRALKELSNPEIIYSWKFLLGWLSCSIVDILCWSWNGICHSEGNNGKEPSGDDSDQLHVDLLEKSLSLMSKLLFLVFEELGFPIFDFLLRVKAAVEVYMSRYFITLSANVNHTERK